MYILATAQICGRIRRDLMVSDDGVVSLTFDVKEGGVGRWKGCVRQNYGIDGKSILDAIRSIRVIYIYF